MRTQYLQCTVKKKKIKAQDKLPGARRKKKNVSMKKKKTGTKLLSDYPWIEELKIICIFPCGFLYSLYVVQ
jgi:hypothetical protein